MSANEPETEGGRARESDAEAVPVEAVPGPAVLYRTAEERFVVERVNRAFEETFLSSLRGESLGTHVHPEDRESVATALRTVAENPAETATAEYRLRTADGDWEGVRMDATGDGAAGRLVATVRPAEMGADETLARDAEGEGIAAVAHEIRNQLEVAMARLEFLAEGHESGHAEAIDRALGRIDRVVTAELEHVRGGGTDADREPVALCDVVAESWEAVATGRARLTCHCDSVVRADRSRLLSLFENLFRNSVEHGTAADRSPGAVAGNGDTAGDAVRIVVGDLPDGFGFYIADDGPGIPAEDREEVFSFGYSTQSGGTGIGLALVREIVQEHGWEIAVAESEAGGARFEVSGVDFLE